MTRITKTWIWSKIVFETWKYHKEKIVLVGVIHNCLPPFGKISADTHEWFDFLINILRETAWPQHFQTYEELKNININSLHLVDRDKINILRNIWNVFEIGNLCPDRHPFWGITPPLKHTNWSKTTPPLLPTSRLMFSQWGTKALYFWTRTSLEHLLKRKRKDILDSNL